jgi:hypothetical protein
MNDPCFVAKYALGKKAFSRKRKLLAQDVFRAIIHGVDLGCKIALMHSNIKAKGSTFSKARQKLSPLAFWDALREQFPLIAQRAALATLLGSP